MTRLISTRCLIFVSLTGALSFAMQILVPGIPLWIGKIELADVPAILGAAFTGPIGGIISGFSFGIGSPVFLALIPSSMCGLAVLGYLSKNLKMGWKGILIAYIVVQPVVGTILFKFIYYGATPWLLMYTIELYYYVPSAIASVPLYVFIEKKIPWIHSLT